MKDKIDFIVHDKYLEVIYTGERFYEDFKELIEITYLKCNETNHKKILVNMLGARGTWKQLDRFKVGEQVSLFFRGKYKILVIDHQDIINKLAEDTAVNRGVNVLVAHDREKHLAWLLTGSNP